MDNFSVYVIPLSTKRNLLSFALIVRFFYISKRIQTYVLTKKKKTKNLLPILYLATASLTSKTGRSVKSGRPVCPGGRVTKRGRDDRMFGQCARNRWGQIIIFFPGFFILLLRACAPYVVVVVLVPWPFPSQPPAA